uniref:E3 ubiquitin-protein ligase TRIM39-like isoform X1 n=1 Tax=Pogona vitticeps TaxID=103695 RepID=A0A6J0SAC9_9SAUR
MAVGGDPSLTLHDEATCSICLDYFQEPMMIVECGHNFCRACLADYEANEAGRDGLQCPQCRGAFAHHHLRPNRHLGNMVDVIRRLNRQRLGKAGEEASRAASQVCEKHQEAVQLFCQEDRAFLCLVCRESRAHKAHAVLPVDEAAQEYKNQLQGLLTTLTTERGEILKEEWCNQDEVQQMKRDIQIIQNGILTLFPEAKDQTQLALLDVCVENMKAIDSIAHDFSERCFLLTKLISEIEDRLQQSTFKCLQNIGDLLSRCKREVSETAKADLKRRAESVIEKLAHVSTKLNELAGSSRGQSPHPHGRSRETAASPSVNTSQHGQAFATVPSVFCPYSVIVAHPQQQQRGNRKKWKKENVLLDPETAHPRYIISDDCKRVDWGDVRQDFFYNPKRFQYARCVLGTRGFKSGKHYWTIDVQDGHHWAVGVARESVERDVVLSFEPDEGIWAMARYCDQYKAMTSPPTILELDDEPTEIQVSLNCDAGTVTFYDAEDLTRLYKFECVDFEGEKVFPFFRISDSSTSLSITS